MLDLNRMSTSKVSATPKSLSSFKSILWPIFNMLQKSVDCLLRRSWKERLSPDYRDILSRASPLELKSEEEFLSIIEKGILIDGGGTWFWLYKDKDTVAKCYVISARKMGIWWSHDERYYRWKQLESDRSHFKEAAQLLQVCWLEISGSIDSRDLSPGTNYGAYLILNFDDRHSGLDVQPAHMSVTVGGAVKSGTAYLRPNKKKELMKKRLQFLYHMQLLLTNPSKSVEQQETEDEEDEEILLGISFGGKETGDGKETEDEEDEETEDELLRISFGGKETGDLRRLIFWGKETEDEEDEETEDELLRISFGGKETGDGKETEDEEDEETEDELLSISFGGKETGDLRRLKFWGKETEDEFVTEDNGGGSPKRTANERADDDWMEIELGTFFIDGDVGMVYLSLAETGGHWKSGLIFQGIEVRPAKEERPVDEVSTVFPSP